MKSVERSRNKLQQLRAFFVEHAAPCVPSSAICISIKFDVELVAFWLENLWTILQAL